MSVCLSLSYLSSITLSLLLSHFLSLSLSLSLSHINTQTYARTQPFTTTDRQTHRNCFYLDDVMSIFRVPKLTAKPFFTLQNPLATHKTLYWIHVYEHSDGANFQFNSIQFNSLLSTWGNLFYSLWRKWYIGTTIEDKKNENERNEKKSPTQARTHTLRHTHTYEHTQREAYRHAHTHTNMYL